MCIVLYRWIFVFYLVLQQTLSSFFGLGDEFKDFLTTEILRRLFDIPQSLYTLTLEPDVDVETPLFAHI